MRALIMSNVVWSIGDYVLVEIYGSGMEARTSSGSEKSSQTPDHELAREVVQLQEPGCARG